MNPLKNSAQEKIQTGPFRMDASNAYDRLFTGVRPTACQTRIPARAPLFLVTWTDGQLVEAGITVAELAGGRLVPGAGEIMFVSYLNAEDRETGLIETATSDHPLVPELRTALAQTAAGIDVTQFETPLNRLSIRHYISIELDHQLPDGAPKRARRL